jgi:predicted TPR repeat methyltransferase
LQDLKYETPINLFNLIRRYNQAKLLDALDLGCGTGLMGVQLRSISKKLDGVDLSQNMLDKAKQRQVYDNLICSEIIEFLASLYNRYDLVVSTDVFVYFGDLTRVFELVHGILQHDGYFCFSVESTDQGDYVLRTTGRYQHSRDYLEQLAMRCGFVVETIDRTIIRQEYKLDVHGFLVIMRRL